MKKAALLFAACCAVFSSQAQISITGGTLTYAQNFDALDTAGYSTTNPGSTNLPAGWAIYEYGSSTTRVNNGYAADSGFSNTGDTYSYGTRGTTERALGSIASGSLTSHYGVRFTNNTGAVITGFTLRYRGEQWRFGGPASPATSRPNADSLRCLYSVTADSVGDTASAKYVEDPSLLFNSVNYSGTSATALNGNAAGNNTIKSATESVTIPVGGTLVIKWIDKNIQGSDDALAIDSFSIVFTLGGPSTPRPSLISHIPASNATGISTPTTLRMVFDRQVVAGTGNIYIRNRNTQTTTTIAAASPNVTIAGYVVTVSSLGLPYSYATYHVTFDSTAFDTASYHSYGLYDTTAWKFTVYPEGIGSIKNASLPFTVCNPASNGIFILSCNMPAAAVLTARVYDLSGREAASRSFKATRGDNHLVLHAALSTGTYVVRVDDGREWGSVKVVMQ